MKDKGFMRNILLWLVVLSIGFTISNALFSSKSSSDRQEISFSEFLQKVESKEIVAADFRGIEDIYSTGKDKQQYYTRSTYYPQLIDRLQENGVEIKMLPLQSTRDKVASFLSNLIPVFVLVGLWWIVFRKLGAGGAGKAFSFGQNRAKLQVDKHKVTFADVAGIEEAKGELLEIVEFLKDPGKYQRLGAKIPRGCLLIGEPGTGKTLLARAIAGEAEVPFFSISGSDFVEMFVGVGASRVRDMFEQAKKHKPCIVFIDEIDAVGRHRGVGIGGGNDEREQTLNQLLVEMDGFAENDGVIIIAATNRPDVLDKALLRPGRFDRQITVPQPDIRGREAILEVSARKVKLAPDVDFHTIARGTPGFTGAELASLINEAALLAVKNNQNFVTMRELESARDKVIMGGERRSMVMSEDERRTTAYHEGGHAIVILNCKNFDPLHKATIIPRGSALGVTTHLPERDKISVSRAYLKEDVAVSLGGRVAEELVFGHEKVTTGAMSDIQHITSLATGMVKRWGLSDTVGPIFYDRDDEQCSEETNKLIDAEVKRIINEGYELAKQILTDKRKDLDILAEALLEYETLTADEIKALLAGKKIHELRASQSKHHKTKNTKVIDNIFDE